MLLACDARAPRLLLHRFGRDRSRDWTWSGLGPRGTARSKIIPSIQAFQAAHQLPEVTVVADAGMLSDGNLRALSGAGLRFIVGQKIPDIPYVVRHWMDTHPGEQPPDGLILTQPCSRPSPSPDGSRAPPASASRPSSRRCVATAPSTSKPATPSSPTRTPYPTTHKPGSTRSTKPAGDTK